MQAELNTWNDERMEEFATRTDANFAAVDAGFAEVRDEFKAVRREIREEVGGLRAEMNVRFASLERRFDVMIGALVSGVVGLIVTHLIG